MGKNPKIRCPECGALYDPNQVEHVALEGQPLQSCIVVPVEQGRWDD